MYPKGFYAILLNGKRPRIGLYTQAGVGHKAIAFKSSLATMQEDEICLCSGIRLTTSVQNLWQDEECVEIPVLTK